MCCYGILLRIKWYMGAKENQSNLQRKKVPSGCGDLSTATSFIYHRTGYWKCSREKCYPPLILFLTISSGDCGSGAGRCLLLPNPCSSLITMRLTWSSHIPAGSFLAPTSFLTQLRQQFLNLFSNNHGPSPTLWPWMPRVAGMSCDPLTRCLWPWGHW